MASRIGICNRAIELIENAREWVSDALEDNYYVQERGVLHGLPIAVISSIALGYLFESGGFFASAAYGLVNYAVVTTGIEVLEPANGHKNKGLKKYFIAVLVIGAGFAVGQAFVHTVLRTNLTYLQAIPLAAGAYLGQVARQWRWNSDSLE